MGLLEKNCLKCVVVVHYVCSKGCPCIIGRKSKYIRRIDLAYIMGLSYVARVAPA